MNQLFPMAMSLKTRSFASTGIHLGQSLADDASYFCLQISMGLNMQHDSWVTSMRNATHQCPKDQTSPKLTLVTLCSQSDQTMLIANCIKLVPGPTGHRQLEACPLGSTQRLVIVDVTAACQPTTDIDSSGDIRH